MLASIGPSDVPPWLQGADIDAKHAEGGSVLTEFAGEDWADLIKQVATRPAVPRVISSSLFPG